MMIDKVRAYIPIDRQHAMMVGHTLSDRTTGAVLFADISGFTPLTGALAKELGRKRGAEEVLNHINPVYDAVIAELHQYGGSVIGFAGDAVTCWLDDNPVGIDPAVDINATTASHRATACALAMQEAMQAFTTVYTPAGTPVSLGIKVSVAAGDARRFLVGDPNIQVIDVLAGATLERMAAAEGQAEKGDIVISREVADALGDDLDITEWRTEAETERPFAVVNKLNQAVPATPWAEVAEDGLTIDMVRPWVVWPIFDRLSTGSDFLGELRPVSPLFLKFGGIDFDVEDDAGAKLDKYISWVQSIVSRFEGTLVQLTIGDKGCFLYAAFGAPIAHHDDPHRSVAAALALRAMPPEMKFIKKVQTGVSRGQVWTGACGAVTRRTFGVMGNQVNMSARLMAKAKPGQILVHFRVQKAAEDSFNFNSLGSIMVKGRAEPLPVAEVVGQRVASAQRMFAHFTTPLVGRDTEEAQLQQWLTAAGEGAGQVVQLEGSMGLGKSHLAALFIQDATSQGWRLAAGLCQSITQDTLYHSWQQVMRIVLGLPSNPLAGQSETDFNQVQAGRLTATIGNMNPEWEIRLPLLGDLLGLPIPENETTSAFDPQSRQESLFALVIDILRLRTQNAPLLLIIEDAHWLDEPSQALATAVARTISQMPILLLIIQRPALQDSEIVLPDLARLANYHHMELTALTEIGVSQLTSQRLGGGVASPLILSLMQTLSQGNPLFTKELVNTLRETDQLQQRPDGLWDVSQEMFAVLRDTNCLTPLDDEWVLRQDASLTSVDLNLPDSVQGTVLARIDRLPERQKLTLKVASVIGRIFKINVLQEVHPVQQAIEEIIAELLTMQEGDFVFDRDTLIHLFRHSTTKEVVYETLLFAQRKELHSTVAQWYEGAFGRTPVAELTLTSGLAPYYPLMVYHWHHAEDVAHERAYATLAGEQAVTQYANDEAIRYFTRALALTAVDDLATRYRLVRGRERAYDLQGARQLQLVDLETMRQLAEGLEDVQRQAEAAYRQAHYGEETSDYPAAIAAAQTAIELAQAAQDVHIEIESLLVWGESLMYRGMFDEAKIHLQHGVSLAETAVLPGLEAASLRFLGVIDWIQSTFESAISTLTQARDIFVDLGDKFHEAQVLNNLGTTVWKQGKYDQAENYYTQSLNIRRQIGHQRGEAMVLNTLAIAYADQGKYELADNHYRQGLRICRQIGDRVSEGSSLNNLGTLSRWLGDNEQAKVYFEQALEIAREVEFKMDIALISCNYCLLLHLMGNNETGLVYIEEAIKLTEEMSKSDWLAESLTTKGHALMGLDRPDEARAVYQRAHDIQKEIGQMNLGMESLAGLAKVALTQRQVEQAFAHVEAILSYLETGSLHGAIEPFRVHWTNYEVLTAAGDAGLALPEQAQTVLANAHSALQEQAHKIQDEALRRQFLENIMVHQQITGAFQMNNSEG